ncbi:MAG: lysozyme [Alphaproteobacteria bacterium]|nr:lysozyme [Alphaproteobacteria bacterium]
MIDINIATKRLHLHEGLRLKPYYCIRGKQTIGIGHNLDANPITEEEAKVLGDWHHGITTEGAYYLLRRDINRTIKECRDNIKFFDSLDDERQYALVDMAFNLGIKGLLKFKNMLGYMSQCQYQKASKECLNSNYTKQTGKRAQRIAQLIKTGQWQI